MRNPRLWHPCALVLAISVAILVVLGVATSASAETLSNGRLVLEIRDDNGAIDEVTFDGIDFFDLGIPVANFGLQWPTDPGTFRRNTTDGLTTISPVDITSDGTTITATARYRPLLLGNFFRLDLSIVREYQIVPGTNTVRIRTTLTNNMEDELEGIQFYDLFDPDGAVEFDGRPWPPTSDALTFNDVRRVGSVDAAVSVGPRAFVPPFLEPTSILGNAQGGRPTLGYTSFLGLTDGFEGSQLRDLFENDNGRRVRDPDGVQNHLTVMMGFELTLGSGESATLQFDYAFGENPETAKQAFITAVPEPSVSSGLAVGVTSLLALARWQRRPATYPRDNRRRPSRSSARRATENGNKEE